MQIFKNANYDFIRWRWHALVLSSAVIIGSDTPVEERMTLAMPEDAENGNIVPYTIAVESPMTETEHITRVHLLSTQNPQASVATFHFTPLSGKAQVSGRMRLAKTQEVVAVALSRWPRAVVTDIGSVKVRPLREVAAADDEGVRRYVGSHPMAGSERSGPVAASADLFDGRAWAVTPHERADPSAIAAVQWLVATCQAVLVRMSPEEHDAAVARMSHLPHVLAALTAARLVDAPRDQLSLAGQGLRDVTRIAAGDPSSPTTTRAM